MLRNSISSLINHYDFEFTETESPDSFAQKDNEKEDEISVEESDGTDPVATSAANADSNEIEQEFLESENETNSQDKLLGELFSCTIHLL